MTQNNENEDDLNLNQVIRDFVDHDNLNKFGKNITLRKGQGKVQSQLISNIENLPLSENDFLLETKKTDYNCKFCFKVYKKKGPLFNHELKCSYNPTIYTNFTMLQSSLLKLMCHSYYSFLNSLFFCTKN